MIKISVIVPICNVEKYLAQCLQSIIEQTLQELEIVCIDDGSTDSSGEILDKYAARDARIKVIHKNNTGYGNSMNVGLKVACGEYIGIVESDDFIEKNMYKELYAIAQRENLDFVKSRHWEYSDAGKKLIYDNSVVHNKVFSKYENMNKIFSYKSIWSGIYKRQFLEQNHICFLETPGASYQDVSFWFKVCITANKGYISENAYVNYRVDNSNSSMKSRHKVYCICDEMEECKKYLVNSKIDIEYIFPYFVVYKAASYIWNITRILPQYRQGFIDRVNEELKNDKRNLDVLQLNNMGIEKWLISDLTLLVDFPKGLLRYVNENYTTFGVDNVQGFKNLIRKEQYIYIYGAGKVGHGVAAYITSIEKNCVIQYVVTAKNMGKLDNIFEINDEKIDVRKAIIISVASEYMKREMLIRALERGFESVFVVGNSISKLMNDIVECK